MATHGPRAAKSLILKDNLLNILTITTYGMHPQKRIHDLVCQAKKIEPEKPLYINDLY